MRPRKFRLLYKKKIVGYQKFEIITHKDIITEKEIKFLDTRYSEDNKKWHGMWIMHDNCDDFTGYLDINDEELYENDIVRITYDDSIQESTIDWMDGGFFVDCRELMSEYDSYLLAHMFDLAHVEKIGDIYE